MSQKEQPSWSNLAPDQWDRWWQWWWWWQWWTPCWRDGRSCVCIGLLWTSRWAKEHLCTARFSTPLDNDDADDYYPSWALSFMYIICISLKTFAFPPPHFPHHFYVYFYLKHLHAHLDTFPATSFIFWRFSYRVELSNLVENLFILSVMCICICIHILAWYSSTVIGSVTRNSLIFISGLFCNLLCVKTQKTQFTLCRQNIWNICNGKCLQLQSILLHCAKSLVWLQCGNHL